MRYKLFLDDERWPAGDPQGWDWVIARNFNDAVWYVENYGVPYFISLDHDLGAYRHSGDDFAKWFADAVIERELILPIGFDYFVHSMNPVGAENIKNRMVSFLNLYADIYQD